MGLDYFFGDPIQNHLDEPSFDRAAWFAKVKGLANEATPKWIDAVREKYGVWRNVFIGLLFRVNGHITRPRRKVRRSWFVFERIY